MPTLLRPLSPVRPLLRKNADQLGLFGDLTPVRPTAKARARQKLYGNVAAPVAPKPKTAPKPIATPGKKPKEGDTRTNRAGNKEVLRRGRWRLADNPQVVAKEPAAIVPVVEDLREADLVDESLPDVPMADPEITLEDVQGTEPMQAEEDAEEMAGEKELIAPKTSGFYWHGISRDALTGAGIEEAFKRATGLDADEKHIKLLLSTAAKDGTSLWELPDDSVSSSKNRAIGMRHFELEGFVVFDRPSQKFFITSKGIKAVKSYYKEKSKLLGTNSYTDDDPVDDIDPLSRIKVKREIDEIERIKADEQAEARLAEGPKVPGLDIFGKRVADSIRQKLNDYGMAEKDLQIDLWQAIEYAKHDRGLSWPKAVDWAMSRRAKPTPEPMPEEAGGNKTREDRLNSDGVILGSYFVNQDWSSDEPGAKIVQELKLRKLQSSDYVRYNDSLNSGDRFVLERRFVRMNDVNGRTLEDEWRPVLFGASEDNLIATTEVKKIDEIADSKVQELADLRIKAEAEAKAAERAKEEQKAKEYQEYLDWENSHVQAQYAATKGKKQKVTINLVSEGGNKIDPKEVDATVYGKLAVHKSLERFSPGYVVTHIPSGMAVYRTEDFRHAHRVATTFHNEVNWPDDPSNLSEEDRLKAKNIEEAFATLKKPNHIDLKASPVIRKKESKAKKPTLTKSLRPAGPYLTLLGVPYVLDSDRGILRKAAMDWEVFREEADAMYKEANKTDDDPCWKGYEAVGLKRKGKRMVPNCVPVSR